MSARFRIRTSQGQEISFASLEMFAEFVRAGDLSPSDVVYDAETREWASALTHPVVLEIQVDLEEEEAETADSEAAAPETTEGAPDTTPTAADIGLELAPAPDVLTPDQQAAAFVKKMEAERASTRDFDEEPQMQGFKMEQGSSGLVGGLGLVDAPEEKAPPPKAPARPPRREEPREPPRREPPIREWESPRREEARTGPSRREPLVRKGKKGESERKAKRAKKGSGGAWKYAAVAALVAALGAAGVILGPDLLAPSTETATNEPQGNVETPPPPPPPPLIPDTEEALRERAQERYLTSTRTLLRDLPPIPDVWLQGSYLAAPSDYPQVREVWSQYLTLMRQLREDDEERYRAGYQRALDEAQVEGSARTLRLAGALSAFQDEGPARGAYYDRVEALATAAIRGHDALLQAEGTIAYEPAAGTAPVPGDPVIGAVGRDPDAQALLEQVLDMIRTELDAPQGPGGGANVGEWVRDGLLDAVAR